MYTISVNMSALPICQVGDKQECCDNGDYVTVEIPTRVKVYILLGELWWNVVGTRQVLLYSSLHDNIAHTAVQLLPNDRFSNCVLLYWLYKLYCSGRLGEVHRVMAVATEMVLQWHCLLNYVVCSTATDCWSIFPHKLRDTERCVTSNTVMTKEQTLTPSSGLCLHTASCNQLSAQFRTLCADLLHNFYVKYRLKIVYQ